MIEIDTREFNRTLLEYLRLTSRDLPEALNRKHLEIQKTARLKTPVASRQKIESDLAITYAQKISKKGKFKGQVRRGKIQLGRNIYALVNWNQRRNGKAPIPKDEMQAAAKAFAAKRLRAVGALQAGWVKPIKAFLRVLGIPETMKGGKGRAGKGMGIPAKPGFSPTSLSIYNMLSRNTQNQKYIDPRVEQALRDGFNKETASMRQYIEDKLQKRANTINAK